MLINFSVENYKSFKEKAVFSLLPGSYQRNSSHVFNSKDKTIKILRGAAIYGNNGAGKTNLIDAISFLKSFVVNGTRTLNEAIGVPKFKLDSNYLNKQTVFEIDFLHAQKRYLYKIVFFQGQIIEEFLLTRVYNKEELIFSRILKNDKIELKFGEDKKLTTKEKLKIEIYGEVLRNNQPFLLEGFNRNIERLQNPYKWFAENLKIIKEKSFIENDEFIYKLDIDPVYRQVSNSIIQSLKVGIEEIRVVKENADDFFGKADELELNRLKGKLLFKNSVEFVRNKNRYAIYQDKDKYVVSTLVTFHNNYEGKMIEFRLNEESRGINRILELLPAIIEGVVYEKTFIIDEIETSIHPIIIKELVKIFLNAGQDYAGQLIFSTHESHLLDLDLLRQDEVWFVEKCKEEGQSKIYSLHDFKPKPRHDKDIRKGYLEGQFSDIPFLSNTIDLNWDKDE